MQKEHANNRRLSNTEKERKVKRRKEFWLKNKVLKRVVKRVNEEKKNIKVSSNKNSKEKKNHSRKKKSFI